MSFIKRQRDMGDNKPKGSIVTDPKQVDEVLRAALWNIFKGNNTDLLKAACDFMHDYGHLCFRADEYKVDDIEWQDIAEIFRNGQDSSPGLDGWHASDLKYLSDLACKLLTGMFNKIEKGAPWPDHMLQTRAVFLSKDPNNTTNPLNYRILKKHYAKSKNGKIVLSHMLKEGFDPNAPHVLVKSNTTGKEFRSLGQYCFRMSEDNQFITINLINYGSTTK